VTSETGADGNNNNEEGAGAMAISRWR